MVRGNQARRWYEQYQVDVARQAAYEARQQTRGREIEKLKRVVGGAAAATGAVASFKKKPSKEKMSFRRPAVVSDDEDTDMDVATQLVSGGELSTRVAATGGAQPAKKGSEETAITPQRPHYGLPETITAVMPSTFYFSALVDTSKDVMVQAEFRLTSMTDQSISTFSTPTPATTYSRGLYSQCLPTSNATAWPAAPNIISFPTTGAADNSTWRTYYHKMYQYYRVLGIEYEFVIQNTQYNVGNDVLVATVIDTYSLQSAVNVHPLGITTKPSEMEQWSDVRWNIARSSIDGTQNDTYLTVKGYYKPGKVRQNVENDEDVTTWTKVGQSPDLTEKLTILFGKTPFNTSLLSHGVNVRVKMRKIVQYKDLNVAYRWPAASLTDIILTAPDDIQQ